MNILNIDEVVNNMASLQFLRRGVFMGRVSDPESAVGTGGRSREGVEPPDCLVEEIQRLCSLLPNGSRLMRL